MELVPIGTTIIDYGIYDSDGNVTHELVVGQKYEIRAHFKSDLDESVPFTYFIQILDKDLHWTETVEEFHTNGVLQSHEEKSFTFEWIPEYEGRFRTFSEVGNTLSQTTIGGVPQYDFVVTGYQYPPDSNYVDFRDAEGKIIEVGCSVGLRASPEGHFGESFLEFIECATLTPLVLAIVLPFAGIVSIFIIWRKRK
ncbi:hypothetical protein [Nitrosopumilus piranensis]|nr:hypothetical protein [Nitrosopumilus piranensis]